MLIYTQDENGAALIRYQGFTNIRVLKDENHFVDGLSIYKTDDQHGSNELYADAQWGGLFGDACGLVFTHYDEKKRYVAGDTVCVKPYAKSLQRFRPDVVVLNTGYAINDLYGPIIMGKEDTLRTLQMLPTAIIIASHMKTINHCLLTRVELREFRCEHGIEEQVFIPADGETLAF